MPCRDRISLSASRRGRTFEAVLDGSIPVAVKCLNIPRGKNSRTSSFWDVLLHFKDATSQSSGRPTKQDCFSISCFLSCISVKICATLSVSISSNCKSMLTILHLADVLSDARLQELALQQLALNEAGYFVHFHGICRSDDSIMLVYDFIEVAIIKSRPYQPPHSNLSTWLQICIGAV